MLIHIQTTSSNSVKIGEGGIMISTQESCELKYNYIVEQETFLGLPTTLDIYNINNKIIATISFTLSFINNKFYFKSGDGELLQQVFKPLNSYVYPTDFYK
jgi:hypothetical protein